MAGNTYGSVGQRTNVVKGSGSFGKSNGKQRADFALSGGRFPLNTPGRVAAAPGLAERSLHAGNISAAEAAHVKAAAAAKRKHKKGRGIINAAAEESGEMRPDKEYGPGE